MSKLKLIGYWNNKSNDFPQYPHPKDLIDPEFYKDFCKENYIEKGYIEYYLDNGIICNRYRGFSSCRICGDHLGSTERHDNVYVWPDKLSHYVKEHDVKLPLDFLKHIVSSNRNNFEFDEDGWTI